jgi:hypothetical protein
MMRNEYNSNTLVSFFIPMPTIIQSFQGHDIGFLRIVARFWGIDVGATDTDAFLKELMLAFLNPRLVGEVVDTLPDEARIALQELTNAGGKLPWAFFLRRFGKIREGGPGWRDREQVFLHPTSASEVLFYRGLLARAFLDMPAGLQEFAYIPDEFIPLVFQSGPDINKEKNQLSPGTPVIRGDLILGHLASPREREQVLICSDRILDDATTLLAAMRMGISPPETYIPVSVVKELLKVTRIIAGRKPQIETVRGFLEASRTDALQQLVYTWKESETFNELRQVPGLVCEGGWNNQPREARLFLLDLLEVVPEKKWWSLPAFVASIKEKFPDFQRPAGDYDSWIIKRRSDGKYLRGFDDWDNVDGDLLRYLISGPLFWLAQVELATPSGSDTITAFRIVSNSHKQISPSKDETVIEKSHLNVSSQGRIVIPRLLSRASRYQIARFCEWGEEKPNEYNYRITPTSLQSAIEHGLKINQLLSLLARNATAEIPPAFIKALKRWELKGTEARMELQTVLRVGNPEILEEIRRSKSGRFLGESLGPVSVIIKPGAQPKVLAALAELGWLAENLTEDPGEWRQAHPKERN